MGIYVVPHIRYIRENSISDRDLVLVSVQTILRSKIFEIYTKWKTKEENSFMLLNAVYLRIRCKIQGPTRGTVATLIQMVAQIAISKGGINYHSKF